MRVPWRTRLATGEDTDAMIQLINSAYRGESSRLGWTTEADLLGGQRTDAREITALLADPAGCFLLADDEIPATDATGNTANALLGCLHLKHDQAAVWIGMFAIRPGQQGNGLGSRLLREAEARSLAIWRPRCWRMAVISNRDELLAYYARRGYHDTGERLPFPDEIRFGLPRVDHLCFSVIEKPCPAVADQHHASDTP